MAESKKTEIKKAFLYAFPYTLPIFTGFLVLGVAYGILMQTKGYGAMWSVLMSLIAYCGSMQFVAITLLVSAFNPMQAFLLSILVNARHLFYGISMLSKYKGLGKIKYFLIYVLCDETFSISYSTKIPEGINKKYFYFFVSFLDYFYWAASSFLGGFLGNFITFNTKGLDFVLTALFVVLFMEQMKEKENRVSGVIGIICTTISLVIFKSNNLVIPAMIMIMASLLIRRKKECIFQKVRHS